MTGKQHLAIGSTVGLAVGVIVNYTSLKGNFHEGLHGVKDIVILSKSISILIGYIVAGGIGALVPDIDCEKSIIAKQFNRGLVILFWAFIIGTFIFKLSVKRISGNSLQVIKEHIYLTVFVINTTLGKMSPHRGYTHKILGTSIFLICIFNLLSLNYSIAFALGYIIGHIVMDGEFFRFFQIRFPLTNTKGKLKIHF